MKSAEQIRNKMQRCIVSYLSVVPGDTRKNVIDGALSQYGLTPEEMQDHSPNGTYNILRGYAGQVLDSLVCRADVLKDNDNYHLGKEELVIVEHTALENQIIKLLKTTPLTKAKLFKNLETYFGTRRTVTLKDDSMLRSVAGTILRRLQDEGAIQLQNGTYTYTQSEINYKQLIPLDENTFRVLFLARLHSMGGEFFERFTTNLLKNYYLACGKTILTAEVTGGSDDGGIDCIIDTVDELGFKEHILIQTKCRERIHVTEKEIREFYGAVCAKDGSRGIFVTTSVFHSGAIKLLDSLDNCVGLDGEGIFRIALKVGYGIHRNRNGFTFDNRVFTR